MPAQPDLRLALDAALNRAWSRYSDNEPSMVGVPEAVTLAVETILANDSAPNRQILLAIAAGTSIAPGSNPAALQTSAGLDRRGQAYQVRDALAVFRLAHSLTLKTSQDAGVSNQWREPEINRDWVARRRKQDQGWAQGFLDIVTWLSGSEAQQRATLLLDVISETIVAQAASNSLEYPRFPATAKIAMSLVREFLRIAPDRPDAMETVVTVAARELATTMDNQPSVQRSDINSPDPIDVLIASSDGEVYSGIEVTDAPITLPKLQHEVVPAMTKLGLERATVVCHGIPESEKSQIETYLARVHGHLMLQIDIVTIEVLESWLTFPATPASVASDFLHGIGDELDQFSREGNRRAWLSVLTDFITAVSEPGT